MLATQKALKHKHEKQQQQSWLAGDDVLYDKYHHREATCCANKQQVK